MEKKTMIFRSSYVKKRYTHTICKSTRYSHLRVAIFFSKHRIKNTRKSKGNSNCFLTEVNWEKIKTPHRIIAHVKNVHRKIHLEFINSRKTRQQKTKIIPG